MSRSALCMFVAFSLLLASHGSTGLPAQETRPKAKPAEKIVATARALRRSVTTKKLELPLTAAAKTLGQLLQVPVVLDSIPKKQRATKVTLAGGTPDEMLRGALAGHKLSYGIDLAGRVRVHAGAAPPALDAAALGKAVLFLDMPFTVEFDRVELTEVLEFLTTASGRAIHFDPKLVKGKMKMTKMTVTVAR